MHTKSFDTAVDAIGGENNTDLKDGQFKACLLYTSDAADE
mgnify:CR=1 FL=1